MSETKPTIKRCIPAALVFMALSVVGTEILYSIVHNNFPQKREGWQQMGYAPLHRAITMNNHVMVEALLQRGHARYINTIGGKGRSPMHNAALASDADMIKLLFDYGARLNDPDANMGDPPILLAAFNGKMKTPRIRANAQLLMEMGADPNRKNRAGISFRTYMETWAPYK